MCILIFYYDIWDISQSDIKTKFKDTIIDFVIQ